MVEYPLCNFNYVGTGAYVCATVGWNIAPLAWEGRRKTDSEWHYNFYASVNFVNKIAEIFVLAAAVLRKIHLYPANLGEDGEIRFT